MNKAILLLSLLAMTICADEWAILVAGSKTYSNYRHQSDVFHAYQILKKNGFDENKIIVFAYDDIAENRQNPFKGEVFNQPDGPDVYKGVKIDYVGKDVTPNNFIAVITGDKSKLVVEETRTTSRVLESNSESNVFIYWTDHGGENLIAFPDKYLYRDEFLKGLETMHSKQLYKHLVFYLEACESGSMFVGLPEDIQIFATTAANGHESSYAAYCGAEAKVRGQIIGSCLGDEYSVRWMEDSDSIDLKTETLYEQYEKVKSETHGSHVQIFGDMSFKDSPLSEFQGAGASIFTKVLAYIRRGINQLFPKNMGLRNVYDVRLSYFKELAERTNDPEDLSKYYLEVELEEKTKKIFSEFDRIHGLQEIMEGEIDFDCYRQTVDYYDQKCKMDIDRDFKYMKHLANFCRTGKSPIEANETFKHLCKGRLW